MRSSRRTGLSFSSTLACSAARASCRSARARATAPGGRAIGSRARIRPHRRSSGKPKRTGKSEMAINYRSHFAYRIDAWDADGENVIEHLAGVEDPQVAKATYLAACQRWPGTPITLRQGTRVIEDSRRTRLV